MASNSAAAAESAPVCSICLEPVVDNNLRSTARLQCGHVFHLDCIGSEFNVKGAMQCPNCRAIENGEWLYSAGDFGENNDDDEEEEEQQEQEEEEIIEMSQSELLWCMINGFDEVPSLVGPMPMPMPTPVPDVHHFRHSELPPPLPETPISRASQIMNLPLPETPMSPASQMMIPGFTEDSWLPVTPMSPGFSRSPVVGDYEYNAANPYAVRNGPIIRTIRVTSQMPHVPPNTPSVPVYERYMESSALVDVTVASGLSSTSMADLMGGSASSIADLTGGMRESSQAYDTSQENAGTSQQNAHETVLPSTLQGNAHEAQETILRQHETNESFGYEMYKFL